MANVRRRVWWVLVALTVLITLFGIGDIFIGVAFDPAISVGLTGLTPAEVEADSAVGYRLFDFTTRTQGLLLVAIGVVLTTILLIPYREGERWAWYAMWIVPIWWVVGAPGLYLAYGLAPGQPPPPPMVSGPVLGIIAVAALLVDRHRFFVDRANPFSV
jgi:hypothetical protein